MTRQCAEPCDFQLLKEGGEVHFVGRLFCVLDDGHDSKTHKYVTGIEE